MDDLRPALGLTHRRSAAASRARAEAPVAAVLLSAGTCLGLTACAGEDLPAPASNTQGTFGDLEDVVRQVMACGSAPLTAAEVGGFGRLVGGDGPLVERLRAAGDPLQAAGWTEAGSDLSGEDPGIGLMKGPAQLVLGDDIQNDGAALGFSIGGSCYRTESGDAGRIGRTRTFDFAP